MKHPSAPFKSELIMPQLLQAVREWGRLALSIQEQGLHTKVKSTKEELVTERIFVSTTPVPQKAKLIYSPPYPKDKEAYAIHEIAIARIENEIPLKITSLGSQVIEAIQVAEGKQDMFIHFQTKPWDIAAASIIVTEAGGRCFDVTGNNYILFGETILLANGKMDIAPVTRIICDILHSEWSRY